MDYGADDPLGIAHQLYLQELIRNNPNIARTIAASQGQYDGFGITPVDPAQDRYSANMRQDFPMEYFLGRAAGNVTGNPMGAAATVGAIRNRLAGPQK
jgi:hypothetical protein